MNQIRKSFHRFCTSNFKQDPNRGTHQEGKFMGIETYKWIQYGCVAGGVGAVYYLYRGSAMNPDNKRDTINTTREYQSTPNRDTQTRAVTQEIKSTPK